jgi:hypothetical protein
MLPLYHVTDIDGNVSCLGTIVQSAISPCSSFEDIFLSNALGTYEKEQSSL